uniref:Target of Nesh-SH3-like n=1 Tax=Sinocyclocheilus grahami TaxID=75366 RepID=A0A672PNB9_SINGR
SSSLLRQNMKVRINATGDTIVLKFVRPNPDVKLEGYILGYGSSMFSKQFIQLPENGEPYETEIDAEPKYLVAVQPIPTNDVKKHCTGSMQNKNKAQVDLDLFQSFALNWHLKSQYKDIQYFLPLKSLVGDPCSLFLSHFFPIYENIALFPTAPPMGQQGTVAAPRANEPKWPQLPLDSDSHVRNDSSQLVEILPILPQLLSAKPSHPSITPAPYSLPSTTRTPPHGHSQTSAPSATQMPHSSSGKSIRRDSISSLPSKPLDSVLTVTTRNQTSLGRYPFSLSNGMRPSSPRLVDSSRRYGGSPAARLPNPAKKPNLVSKPGGIDKTTGLSQDKASILKHMLPPVTAKPSKPKTTSSPTVTAPRFETWENSSVFSSVPASKVDALGKERYIAPHVVYKTDKKPDEPCSITTSLSYFPEEEAGEQNVTNPPRTPPSNLTVVTVEGCPSFIILDWEKTDNETTEYEVISTTKGPDGEQVSILTTNQTHTAVENLKPESSYEFKVKPKNELGEGPPSKPVTFNTESADPRVSENVSGKDAIWTQFPFKTDSYSECNGKQYVKRTWYRKFVGIQLCNSLRYKIYLSDSLNGKFYNIGDQTGHGEDHCQFVDSFLDGRTGTQLPADQLPYRPGFYRAMRQEPVHFGQIGGNSHITYVAWYECGTPIPGKW